ncbi:hypothetical protein ACSBR2_016341 [Camellia fascicularis]
MGKLSLGGVLDCLCLSSNSRSCFCMNSLENQDEFESKPLVASEGGNWVKLKDVLEGPQTLAFQLKPKMVVLRVSMHCNGCARKVERHISKMEEMHLANARQTKIDDATDDDIPSTSGRQFTDATFSDSSHSTVSKLVSSERKVPNYMKQA